MQMGRSDETTKLELDESRDARRIKISAGKFIQMSTSEGRGRWDNDRVISKHGVTQSKWKKARVKWKLNGLERQTVLRYTHVHSRPYI